MPFRETAEVVFRNHGTSPVTVELDEVGVADRAWTDRTMYFNSTWRGDSQIEVFGGDFSADILLDRRGERGVLALRELLDVVLRLPDRFELGLAHGLLVLPTHHQDQVLPSHAPGVEGGAVRPTPTRNSRVERTTGQNGGADHR